VKIEKSQVTQTVITVTLETFQECEMLRVIALAAKNRMKEDEAGGNGSFCGFPFSVVYSFVDKLREVANI
jgi:hypothetical protein